MSVFQVDIDTKEVDEMLDKIRDHISVGSLGLFMVGKVWPIVQRSAEQRFADEGDSTVGQWAQLRQATRAIRLSKGYSGPGPINVRTGALKRLVTETFTVRPSGAGGMSLTSPGPASGELAKKLNTAQRGSATASSAGSSTAGPSHPTVARPVAALTMEDAGLIFEALLHWIELGGVP